MLQRIVLGDNLVGGFAQLHRRVSGLYNRAPIMEWSSSDTRLSVAADQVAVLGHRVDAILNQPS